METFNYKYLCTISGIYAVFTALCLYKNPSGITMPLFAIGTLIYFYNFMKRIEVPFKKTGWFYIAGILLLAVSTFMTDDSRIIIMNYIAIILLFMSFMFYHFYEENNWGFGKYIGVIFSMIFYILESIIELFTNISAFRKASKKKENSQLKNIGIGMVIGIPVLLIILALLSSADAVFGSLLGGMLKKIYVPADIFKVLFMIIVVFIVSYGFIAKLAKKKEPEFKPFVKKQDPAIAIVVNSFLLVVYIIFSLIQIVYLFFGKMTLPDGYSYAVYARQGYFQLLCVCVINMALVLFSLYFFRKSKILRGILGAITVCTYILIASSTMRMLLYIGAYGLTFLRIFVLWTLLVMFLSLTGVLALIVKQDFKLLRYEMAVVTLLYIGLAFSHPDFFIADYNLENISKEQGENIGEVDMEYLSGLSADAAEAMASYEEKNPGEYWIDRYFNRIQNNYENDGIREFNVSRWSAHKAGENRK